LHQLSGLSVFNDTMILNNTYNPNYVSFNQGLFMESEFQDGVFIKTNTFNISTLTPESMDAVNGGNNNVVYSGNTFTGNNSFRHDSQIGGKNETFVKDKCTSGGSLLPPIVAGTNLRSYAAASQACYTTSTP
jgi:hypothetical protein